MPKVPKMPEKPEVAKFRPLFQLKTKPISPIIDRKQMEVKVRSSICRTAFLFGFENPVLRASGS